MGTAGPQLLASALPTLRQSLRQLPRTVGTAGPQLQGSEHWAPLDLNLGPSELSEHRWTSTWDPPSSVSTAGPQPGTLRAQWAPLALNGQIECQKICQIERQIIPLGISTKAWDNPGCRKKHFFAKTGGKSTWRTRTPHFLQRFPGQIFLERAFWKEIDKLIEFLQIGKTAVVRRPLFASQMSQAIIWAHWVVLYWLTSTWLTRTPYFLEFCFCICILCTFYVCFVFFL